MLAVVHVSDLYRPDREHEAKRVFGTTDKAHPGVSYLLDKANPVYVAGELEVVSPPYHYDYKSLRLSPAHLRERFSELGWEKIVAFQTRNPMHRAHVELTLRAARDLEANLLIHPSVGMTKPGDVDHHTRVRCYQAVLKGYPHSTATLALLPLAMRMGGPARPCGTPLSGRTTGLPISSWAVTTPAPATTPLANLFTGPTTHRRCSASTRAS